MNEAIRAQIAAIRAAEPKDAQALGWKSRPRGHCIECGRQMIEGKAEAEGVCGECAAGRE